MKKLGLICLVLVISIGCIGIAYAKWSQTLTANNNVSTGTYDVIFNSFSTPNAINGATFSATPDGTDPTHIYDISLSNVYPSLDSNFTFVLKNTGTIPAKITDIKIDGNSVVNTNYKYSKPLGTGHSTNDITISISNISNSTTIAANDSVSGTLAVHTWALNFNGSPEDGNDATQLASGSFTLEIDTEQGD